MNIIEFVKSIVQEFPKIAKVCNEIHVDFTEDTPTNYGLSSSGDTLIKRYVNGDEVRQHTFSLYAVYQSINDYDRITNSGVLLELQMWLENYAKGQQFEFEVGDKTFNCELRKLTCANGMLYAIPNENMNDAVQYQLQISAKYNLYKGDLNNEY